MRRALAILKYIPAVLCGLLVVAWVVSFWFAMRFAVPSVDRIRHPHSMIHLELDRGTLFCTYYESPQLELYRELRLHSFEFRISQTPSDEEIQWNGVHRWDEFGLGRVQFNPDTSTVGIPMPLFITSWLAISLAPFIRFPLWSYFAWTALVAAELAYYLR